MMRAVSKEASEGAQVAMVRRSCCVSEEHCATRFGYARTSDARQVLVRSPRNRPETSGGRRNGRALSSKRPIGNVGGLRHRNVPNLSRDIVIGVGLLEYPR